MSNEKKEESVNRIELIAWLETLKRDFDPDLLKARANYNTNAGWFWIWIFRSLFGASYKKMSEDSVAKVTGFFSNRLTPWASIAVSFGLGPILNSALGAQNWPHIIQWVPVVIGIIGSFWANRARMLTPGDPYFNSNAYRLFRPREYFMFLNYFKENNYSFGTVHTWVLLLYNENSLPSLIQEHKFINDQLRREIEELKSQIGMRDKDLADGETAIQLLNRKIGLLTEQVVINENGYNSAIDSLYRLRQDSGLFNTSDLRVVTAFSLFELIGEQLYRICEQGTTETPREIHVQDPEYQHYSSVKLVDSEKTIEYATSNREGRTVASYWIDLPSERVLIYNFHYDSTNLSMRDIIESKEMFRYIRGLCILLDERGFLEREGARHAKA